MRASRISGAPAVGSVSQVLSRQSMTPSGFGIELQGINTADLDTDTRTAAVETFHESGGLLLIRDQQHLTPEQLCDFVASFGTLEKNEKYNPAFVLTDLPEVLRIGNVKENGEYVGQFIQADPPPLLWHTDDSYRHPQPAGSCLYCLRTPPKRAETGFAGMSAAYQALPDEVKRKISGLTSLHSYAYLNKLLCKTNPHRAPLSDELKEMLPAIRRPLVAEHPVTGRKGLYIPLCHIESVDGMAEDEARPLLDSLLAHATKADFRYMHPWRPGDLVIWDNRSVLHAPTPFDDEKYERLMYRLTFNGQQIVGF